MTDRFFWEQLGLEPGAGQREIKRAYHRMVRVNHPDLFPQERKAIQELKMIALNEAYDFLIRLEPAGRRGAERPSAQLRPRPPARRPEAPGCVLGPHRDPAYAYYKQGFVHFSRALQGIEALYRSLTRRRVEPFKPRDDAYQRFAQGLVELRHAHEYFTRVLEEFGQSIWRHDAELKLERIERFTGLYRRILGNLGRPA
jgi:curved DNA-binding protein CbpA